MGTQTGGQRALLRFLQREKRISAADAERLEAVLGREPASLHALLEREGIITQGDLAALLAGTLRLKQLDLAACPPDPQVVRVLRESIATQYEVLPMTVDARTIEVVTANPLDVEALRAVEFATGRRAQPTVAVWSELRTALANVYRLHDSVEQFLQHAPVGNLTELQEDSFDLRALARDADLPPVIKLADQLLVEGVKTGASDVHVEPGNDGVVVRYRIDGLLEEGFKLPKWIQNPLVSRLKVMAKLDIMERRVPQDGRIKVRYQDKAIDLRISSLPMQHGEKIVCRILDASSSVQSLDHLGLAPADLERLRDAIRRPQGMVLVTGPTGSGKTTTLYAILREIFSPGVNIVTIENPVEYQLKGINQVEINEKQGRTFAGVLRSILRQDPDVILVGEIRDKETAEIALQAAQTGHLVLSTLHTNDTASTVSRLLDLGIEPYALASSLNIIVAQRLVRRVCTACSAPYVPSDDDRRRLRLDPEAGGFRRGTGCPACRRTGYAGRTGVYELLPLSKGVAKLIEAGRGEMAVRQQARADGGKIVIDDALEKLSAGVTTAEEILRVVQLSQNGPQCPSCAHDVAEDYAVCPFCSTVLRAACTGCAKPLSPSWVTCPYCGAHAHEAPAPASSPQVEPPAAVETTRTFKALVVDDEPDIRRILQLALEGAGLGLTVIHARDGIEALALAERERPDIVILDLSMPDVDGFTVCRRLRADARAATVPVLMVTAHDDVESVKRAFATGVDDYIAKPFRREDLVARVGRMIERAYGATSASEEADAAAKPAPVRPIGPRRLYAVAGK